MDYDFNVKCLEETIKLEIARRKCYELFMNNCIKKRDRVNVLSWDNKVFLMSILKVQELFDTHK